MEDRIAISRLKQGDLSAVGPLVSRYQVQAVRAAYAIVHDQALAEDVAQTAFVKIVERIHQFDEGRPFAPWFFRIVINDAVKTAKRQNRNISLDEGSDRYTVQMAEWLISPEPKPEQLLEEREARQIILKAMQGLPPEQRAVIVMRYYLEMSEADITAELERPLSTVKWWLRDARKRLRSLIGPYHAEDGK